jgi:hypothetical protein
MSKIITVLFLLMVMIVPTVAAESLYGIYIEDTSEIVSSAFSDSDIVHLRDNYYGVIYLDGSSNGQLQILELDDNYNIINDSVDTWNFGSGVKSIKMINFDNATGLSIIGYVTSSNQYLNYKSFDVYSYGEIRTLSSVNAYVEDYGSLDFVKSGDLSFLGMGQVANVWSGASYFYSYGGTVTSTGTITIPTDNDRYYKIGTSTSYVSSSKIIQDGTQCYLYYKWSGTGYTTPLSCTSTSFGGGGSSRSTASTVSKSQYEANEINYIDADVDTDAGFVYSGYAETIDKFPVISVRSSTTNSALDKERINSDTATSIEVKTLSPNNILVTYTNGTDLVYKTYTVAIGGTLTEVYSKVMTEAGTNSATTPIFESGNRFISSYTSSVFPASGSVMSFGTGLVPPPAPDDTYLTIQDEKTLGALDTSDLNLTFYAHCTNNTNYQTAITSTSESIPVDCEYESFSIKVDFKDATNTTYNYRRYYLRDLTDTYGQFDLDVYLINPYTTDFVYNEIVIDDLTGGYTNPKVYFEKNINGVTTQITSYTLDTQNSMLAILMNGEEYEVYVSADEIAKTSLGAYRAPSAGDTYETTIFHLYNIILKPNFQKLGEFIEFQVYSKDNQIDFFAKTPDDKVANIINTTLYLYNGTVEEGVLINTISLGSGYDPNNLYSILSGGPYNYSSNINQTTSAKLVTFFSDNSQIRQNIYTVTLWNYDKLTLPLMDYVSTTFMDWFILILLTVIALYATIQTANAASMGIIGLAALFVMFGWFSLSSGTLALAALIALMSWLTQGGKQQ